MDLSQSFAVQIHTEEEDKSVQQKFFSMGVSWCDGEYKYYPFAHEQTIAEGEVMAIAFHTDRTITFSEYEFYQRQGFKIISAAEFLGAGEQTMMITPEVL